MKKRLLVSPVALAIAVALGPGRASAHHAFAGTYLEDSTVTIEGSVVQVAFRNPHSVMHIDVREKNGVVARYAVEWDGAFELGVHGVTKETLKAGDRVIVSGRPSLNPRDHRVRLTALRRPADGFGWGPVTTMRSPSGDR